MEHDSIEVSTIYFVYNRESRAFYFAALLSAFRTCCSHRCGGAWSTFGRSAARMIRDISILYLFSMPESIVRETHVLRARGNARRTRDPARIEIYTTRRDI